jgi:hypothetical protein
MNSPIGYQKLINSYGLAALPLSQSCVLDTSIKGRQLRQQGGNRVEAFEPNYSPEDTLAGQLQFAFRYEGVNLQILALLFAQTGREELGNWIQQSPESRYARIACYLYEWITETQLPVVDPVSPRAKYVQVGNEKLQWVYPGGVRSTRFRVSNNLVGNRRFCPFVRNTAYLQEMRTRNLRVVTANTLAAYEPELLRRAAAYLYLKETQSSFEVEREKPSPQKAQRFADLLRQADAAIPLSEERLVNLQQAVVDPRFHEFTWRTKQNWIGKDHGYRRQVDFVPPRPEDVGELMKGLLDLVNDHFEEGKHEPENSLDAVVTAAVIAFGFVYIHPFLDGNGRIHRYLFHDILTKAKFTPRGIILPVSAVILANLDGYIETLEHFSRPLNALTEYYPDTPDAQASGNDAVYFQYPDLTRQAEFLYQALERTITHDLPSEIAYLLGFDTAYKALNELLDWPAHSLELFIRVVRSNNGKLSKSNQMSHFDWLTREEIFEAERMVQRSFGMNSD